MMGGLLLPGLVQAQNHPCDPPSVIPCHVCRFDTFYGSPPRQLPNGWTGFVLAGDLTFMQDIDTFWGAPALRMWSNGGIFKAGVFTRVRVTPGAGYRAAVFWAAPNAPETFGRQLGIDPTGGVDPTAPTVIWGAYALEARPHPQSHPTETCRHRRHCSLSRRTRACSGRSHTSSSQPYACPLTYSHSLSHIQAHTDCHGYGYNRAHAFSHIDGDGLPCSNQNTLFDHHVDIRQKLLERPPNRLG